MEKIPRGTHGFTLIEMVVTILIVSILAVFATSRLDLDFFEEAGFFQQSSTAIRYAQKLAIGSNCCVRVQVASFSRKTLSAAIRVPGGLEVEYPRRVSSQNLFLLRLCKIGSAPDL